MKKYPHYRQQDKMDCGAACLKMVAAYYRKNISFDKLHKLCFVGKQGVSLVDIRDAAEKLGFRTKAVRANWDSFVTLVSFPCIVHWNQNHFIVVYKVEKRWGKWRILVADSNAPTVVEYTESTFKEFWLKGYNPELNDNDRRGVVLLLEPTKAFYDNQNETSHQKNLLYFIQGYIRPYWKYILQLFLAMLTTSLITLIIPFTTQVMVDKGIGLGDLTLLKIILFAQFFLIFGQTVNSFFQSWLMLHVTTRVSITIVSDFLTKLMRLPIAFFDSRKVGDIIQRIQDSERIRVFLTESLLNMTMSILSFILYSFIMGGYSMKILLIFMGGSLCYIIWIFMFLAARRKLDYMRFQKAGENQSNVVQLITGMQDIKLNNCEQEKRWEWERIQVKLFKISLKALNIEQAQVMGGMFIEQAKNILISYIAAKSVVDGIMTLGMMTSMQYIIGQLNSPLQRMISFIHELQDAKISIDRINEIYNQEDEEPQENRIKEIPENADIILDNVSFQYGSASSQMVLKNVNLRIPANKVTAIVGTSGSGKTTLIKLMLGFYQPTLGNITLNNRNLSAYSLTSWRQNCGTVMQDSFVFNDTIAGNIVLSDKNPTLERLGFATQVANIDNFIETLPQGYETKIGMEGMSLSSGQKQRILIARAVYKDCKYLFLDEATNALDATNEKIIQNRLDRLFQNKTVIVAAHRLSTVKNADNIVVIHDGSIVEQGTHQELIDKKGAYFRLVENQLNLGC